MTAAERFWLDECARHSADAADGDFVFACKEESPLSRHLNAIVPVSYACVGERVAASIFPSACSYVSAFFEKYRSADALFSDAAFSELDALLRPYLAQYDYRPAAFPTRYGISLLQDNAACVPTELIMADTVRINDAVCAMKNLTSMRAADCAARGAFAQIVNGEIVCIASVNRVSGGERCAEIGVECAPGYRRRGYASSCVCALTRMLCEAGQTVLYRHYHTNSGSAAVARAAGFVPVGRFFSYTSFAI